MNTSIVCLGLVMIVLFFVACLFIRESNKHIDELKNELEEANEHIDYLRRYSLLISERLDHDEEIWNDEIANNKKEVDDLKKNTYTASHLKGIEGSLKGMLDIVKQEHADLVKWRSEAAERQIKAFCEDNVASEDTGDDDKPYADIPGDLDDGFEGEESITDEQREALEHAGKVIKRENNIPSYHWVFPQEDYGENWPVLGEEYLVIGRERKTGEVVSGVGTWTGIKYDMEDGYKLDKVYADIRLPSPSDVMNEVLDIRFKEE